MFSKSFFDKKMMESSRSCADEFLSLLKNFENADGAFAFTFPMLDKLSVDFVMFSFGNVSYSMARMKLSQLN
jgi:hypothetical protein